MGCAGIGSIRLRALLLSTVFLAGAGVGQASAQAARPARASDAQLSAASDPANSVAEVVVTATRREERLSRVPISVTAFSQATLDRQGAKQIDDIARLTPSLDFTRSSGTASGYTSSISIRGVASLVGAATTGVYIDDTPIQVRTLLIVSGDPFPKLFDLDRIEVLRGPQGTLFGAGSEGGAVRFITPQPNFSQFSGTARVELGDTLGGAPSYETGLALGGPIVEDKVAVRASLWYREDGGWIDRVNPNNGAVLDRDGNSEQSYAGKLAFSFKITPQLTFTPSIYYQNVHDDERSQYWENLSSGSNFRDGSLIPEPSYDRFVLPAAKLEYAGPAFTIVSNSSYFKRDYQSTFDYTQYVLGAFGLSPATPVPAGLPGGEDASVSYVQQRNFTEELRIQSPSSSRLQWVVGGFYTHNEQIGGQHVEGLTSNALLENLLGVGTQQILGLPFVDGEYTFVTRLNSVESQTALFTDLTYPITSKLKINAGVRVARANFSYTQTSEGPFVAAMPVTTAGSESETPVTPKFGISYQWDPNNFYYFSAAKGFRIGGAQPQLISLCDAELASLGYSKSPTSYQSDSLWSYEVGSKNTLFGGRVHLDGSLFYIDWSNIQSRIQLNSCGGSVIVGNLGSATSKGVDLTIQARLIDHLNVSVALGYTDSTYNKTIKANSGAIFSQTGEPIGGPPFNMSVSAQYDLTVFDGLPAYVRADYQYRSQGPRLNPDIFNYDPAIPPTPAQSYLNLRAGVLVNKWDVSAFINNATNAHYGLYRSHDVPSSPLFYNTTVRPLYGGMTAAYKF